MRPHQIVQLPFVLSRQLYRWSLVSWHDILPSELRELTRIAAGFTPMAENAETAFSGKLWQMRLGSPYVPNRVATSSEVY